MEVELEFVEGLKLEKIVYFNLEETHMFFSLQKLRAILPPVNTSTRTHTALASKLSWNCAKTDRQEFH